MASINEFILLNIGLVIGIVIIVTIFILSWWAIHLWRLRKKIPEKVIKEVLKEKDVRQNEQSELHKQIFHDTSIHEVDAFNTTKTVPSTTAVFFPTSTGSTNEEDYKTSRESRETTGEIIKTTGIGIGEQSVERSIGNSEDEGISIKQTELQLSNNSSTSGDKPNTKKRFKLHKPTDI